MLSAALRRVPAIAESGLPILGDFSVVAAPLALLTLVAWLAIGVAPSLWLAFQLDTSRLTMVRHTTTTHRGAGAMIVAAQVALAVVTVALAGAAIQTFQRLSRVNVGFATSGVTVVDFALQGRDAKEARAIQERLKQGLASLPGVTAVGGTSLRPFRFGEIGDGMPVRRAEDASTDADRSLAVNRIVVSGNLLLSARAANRARAESSRPSIAPTASRWSSSVAVSRKPCGAAPTSSAGASRPSRCGTNGNRVWWLAWSAMRAIAA